MIQSVFYNKFEINFQGQIPTRSQYMQSSKIWRQISAKSAALKARLQQDVIISSKPVKKKSKNITISINKTTQDQQNSNRQMKKQRETSKQRQKEKQKKNEASFDDVVNKFKRLFDQKMRFIKDETCPTTQRVDLAKGKKCNLNEPLTKVKKIMSTANLSKNNTSKQGFSQLISNIQQKLNLHKKNKQRKDNDPEQLESVQDRLSPSLNMLQLINKNKKCQLKQTKYSKQKYKYDRSKSKQIHKNVDRSYSTNKKLQKYGIFETVQSNQVSKQQKNKSRSKSRAKSKVKKDQESQGNYKNRSSLTQRQKQIQYCSNYKSGNLSKGKHKNRLKTFESENNQLFKVDEKTQGIKQKLKKTKNGDNKKVKSKNERKQKIIKLVEKSLDKEKSKKQKKLNSSRPLKVEKEKKLVKKGMKDIIIKHKQDEIVQKMPFMFENGQKYRVSSSSDRADSSQQYENQSNKQVKQQQQRQSNPQLLSSQKDQILSQIQQDEMTTKRSQLAKKKNNMPSSNFGDRKIKKIQGSVITYEVGNEGQLQFSHKGHKFIDTDSEDNQSQKLQQQQQLQQQFIESDVNDFQAGNVQCLVDYILGFSQYINYIKKKQLIAEFQSNDIYISNYTDAIPIPKNPQKINAKSSDNVIVLDQQEEEQQKITIQIGNAFRQEQMKWLNLKESLQKIKNAPNFTEQLDKIIKQAEYNHLALKAMQIKDYNKKIKQAIGSRDKKQRQAINFNAGQLQKMVEKQQRNINYSQFKFQHQNIVNIKLNSIQQENRREIAVAQRQFPKDNDQNSQLQQTIKAPIRSSLHKGNQINININILDSQIKIQSPQKNYLGKKNKNTGQSQTKLKLEERQKQKSKPKQSEDKDKDRNKQKSENTDEQTHKSQQQKNSPTNNIDNKIKMSEGISSKQQISQKLEQKQENIMINKRKLDSQSMLLSEIEMQIQATTKRIELQLLQQQAEKEKFREIYKSDYIRSIQLNHHQKERKQYHVNSQISLQFPSNQQLETKQKQARKENEWQIYLKKIQRLESPIDQILNTVFDQSEKSQDIMKQLELFKAKNQAAQEKSQSNSNSQLGIQQKNMSSQIQNSSLRYMLANKNQTNKDQHLQKKQVLHLGRRLQIETQDIDKIKPQVKKQRVKLSYDEAPLQIRKILSKNSPKAKAQKDLQQKQQSHEEQHSKNLTKKLLSQLQLGQFMCNNSKNASANCSSNNSINNSSSKQPKRIKILQQLKSPTSYNINKRIYHNKQSRTNSNDSNPKYFSNSEENMANNGNDAPSQNNAVVQGKRNKIKISLFSKNKSPQADQWDYLNMKMYGSEGNMDLINSTNNISHNGPKCKDIIIFKNKNGDMNSKMQELNKNNYIKQQLQYIVSNASEQTKQQCKIPNITSIDNLSQQTNRHGHVHGSNIIVDNELAMTPIIAKQSNSPSSQSPFYINQTKHESDKNIVNDKQASIGLISWQIVTDHPVPVCSPTNNQHELQPQQQGNKFRLHKPKYSILLKQQCCYLIHQFLLNQFIYQLIQQQIQHQPDTWAQFNILPNRMGSRIWQAFNLSPIVINQSQGEHDQEEGHKVFNISKYRNSGKPITSIVKHDSNHCRNISANESLYQIQANHEAWEQELNQLSRQYNHILNQPTKRMHLQHGAQQVQQQREQHEQHEEHQGQLQFQYAQPIPIPQPIAVNQQQPQQQIVSTNSYIMDMTIQLINYIHSDPEKWADFMSKMAKPFGMDTLQLFRILRYGEEDPSDDADANADMEEYYVISLESLVQFQLYHLNYQNRNQQYFNQALYDKINMILDKLRPFGTKGLPALNFIHKYKTQQKPNQLNNKFIQKYPPRYLQFEPIRYYLLKELSEDLKIKLGLINYDVDSDRTMEFSFQKMIKEYATELEEQWSNFVEGQFEIVLALSTQMEDFIIFNQIQTIARLLHRH